MSPRSQGGEAGCPRGRALYARLACALLLYKVVVLSAAFYFATAGRTSFNAAGYELNFHRHERPGPAERFSTWDGEHYLFLSEKGYRADSASNAFYPLWPFLIHVGAGLFGGRSLIAALVLANAFSLAGWLLFHRLIQRSYGLTVANAALAMLIAHPGALFFQFPYSESLFFFLIVAWFNSLAGERRWLAALCGFLLPLTRAIGALCVLPLACYLWERSKVPEPGLGASLRVLRDWPGALRWVPALLAPVAGCGAYFAIMGVMTGEPLAGVLAEESYVNHPSLLNVLDLQGFIASFFSVKILHGLTGSPIDRLMFLLFVASLPLLWRANRTYFCYAIVSGLVPAMSHLFVSYTRYSVLCFPSFVALAILLTQKSRRWYLPYLFCLFVLIQVSFIVRHVNFRWAG